MKIRWFLHKYTNSLLYLILSCVEIFFSLSFSPSSRNRSFPGQNLINNHLFILFYLQHYFQQTLTKKFILSKETLRIPLDFNFRPIHNRDCKTTDGRIGFTTCGFTTSQEWCSIHVDSYNCSSRKSRPNTVVLRNGGLNDCLKFSMTWKNAAGVES